MPSRVLQQKLVDRRCSHRQYLGVEIWQKAQANSNAHSISTRKRANINPRVQRDRRRSSQECLLSMHCITYPPPNTPGRCSSTRPYTSLPDITRARRRYPSDFLAGGGVFKINRRWGVGGSGVIAGGIGSFEADISFRMGTIRMGTIRRLHVTAS